MSISSPVDDRHLGSGSCTSRTLPPFICRRPATLRHAMGSPHPRYYDGSVPVGLAPGRASRVPVVLHVQARRRCPVHPLECARCTSPIMRRVRAAKVYRHAHDGAASRRGRGECEVPPLGIGVRAMQLSPYRTGLAGRHGTRLPVPPAFRTGSCPLWLSPSGQSMTQESPFELLLTVSRMQHRVPRRTISLHPAPQWCGSCHEYHHTDWLGRFAFGTSYIPQAEPGFMSYACLLETLLSTPPLPCQRILSITSGLGFLGDPTPASACG
jgi:hypothetical protein